MPVSDGSAYREYVLTEKGSGLFPLMVALRQWGEDFFFEPDEAHVQLVDRKRGQPVRRLELRSSDGRVLEAADTVVKRFLTRPASGVIVFTRLLLLRTRGFHSRRFGPNRRHTRRKRLRARSSLHVSASDRSEGDPCRVQGEWPTTCHYRATRTRHALPRGLLRAGQVP